MDATIPNDPDPQETREWLDALSGVIENEGPARAHFLIDGLIARARRNGAYLPFSANTQYINTIPTDAQVRIPGDQNVEHRITRRAGFDEIGEEHLPGFIEAVGGEVFTRCLATDQ